MLTLNTNVPSLGAQNNLNKSQNAMQVSLQRLSSGLRINSAKDDAAGLAISNSLTAQINGMKVASRNAGDAISMAQTADSVLDTMTSSLQRMRELAVQAANGSNSTGDLANLDKEFQELASQVDTYAGTKYNKTIGLFDSTASGTGMTFQVGSESGESLTVKAAADLTAGNVATATSGDITSNANASTALTNIDKALDDVTKVRAGYGAAQSRFESVISNLDAGVTNLSAARSRIMDVDYASETANLTRNTILQQAGTAMLSQANQLPQNILSLIK